MKVVECVKRENIYERTWLRPINLFMTEFEDLWFAFNYINVSHDQDIWDNNSGWNYDTSSEYHCIPKMYSMNKYPVDQFYCGYTVYLDKHLISLNEWLHYSTN
jgi:hypothetical protein